METPKDQMLRATEVATLLGIGERSLARFVKSGRFPKPAKIGKALRFSRQAVQQWIAVQQNGGAR